MRFKIARTILLVLAFSFVAHSAWSATVTVHVGPNGLHSFSPDKVSISVGDTVQWVWDSGGHSATAGTPGHSSGLFDSGIKNSGSFTYTFTSAGTFPYYCSPHGACCNMTGSVAVAAASTPTPTPTPSPTATPSPTPTATPVLPRVQKGTLRVELQTIASGLTAPIDLAAINDGSGRMLVVQQTGQILLLKNGQIAPTPFLDVSQRLVTLNSRYDERGLLGIALHPGFADSASPGFRKFYTFTNEPVSGTADFTVPMTGAFNNQIVIAEWQASATNADVADPATRREVLRINHPQSNHDGGQLAFRPGEQYLYIAIGDGGAANDVGDGHTPVTGNAQDTTNVLGKILRIDPLAPSVTPGSSDPASANGKYRIPASNPFVAAPGVPERVREIYAYGLRNAYRFSFDAPSGALVAADVGQNNVEEIDIVAAGKNYGWHTKEGTFLFDSTSGGVSPDPSPNPAFTDPIAQYSHSDGTAVIGGMVYRGAAIPSLFGRYVFGDLSGTGSGRLFYLDDLNPGPVRELRIGDDDHALGLFLKAFGRDSAGEIYVIADSNIGPGGTGGRLLKMVQATPSPALLNVSTRMKVQTGENVLIGGFIVIGGAPKPLILRGLGPSLPVNGTLQNPLLELHDGSGRLIDSNDDWGTNPRKQEFTSRNIAPTDSRESALFDSLQPGAYTAILKGSAGESGVGLVELYDVDQAAPANAVNISTRGLVQTDSDVMIGGFIIGGTTSQKVLLRAIGPSLAGAGVAGALQDPLLELHDRNGGLLALNDNWKSTQPAEITATGAAPSDDRESAIVTTLTPDAYTAVVRGVNNSVGVALVEVFQLTR